MVFMERTVASNAVRVVIIKTVIQEMGTVHRGAHLYMKDQSVTKKVKYI